MLPFGNQSQTVAIKRYLFEVLKERYKKNENFIERVASVVVTKEDYQALGSFVADLYEAGFMRAVDQYKEQMAKLGLKVNVVPESKKPQGEPIFKD